MSAGVLTSGAGAAPAAPTKVELEQPSGQSFKARLFGDEWYHGYESLDGYTILRERETRVWRYAEEDASGELSPGGPRATAAPPAELEPHLRDESRQEQAESKIERAARAPGDPSRSPSPANLGDQPVLVILAEFNDRNSQTNAASWRGSFFGEGNSVRKYWREASYGNLDLGPATESHGTANDGVVGWVRLNRNHPLGNETAQAQTVRDAVIAADPFVNYASYDDNGNGKIGADELHVVVIPAGYEQASCGASTPSSVWGHNWYTGASTPTVDGKQVGGVGSTADGSYSMFGETHCGSGGGTGIATVGIMVHEIGHDIDLPDLYSSSDGSDGIGAWSVMAGGTWLQTGTQRAGETPSHPDAWSKYYQGWTTPQQRSGTRLIDTAATTPDVMRLGSNPGGVDWRFGAQSGSGEYFLVENRQQVGYDAGLPGCGLVIWHIDETRSFLNDANANGSRRLVDLEEADNNGSAGSSGDPFRNRSFNGASVPNSNFYSGAASGLGVEGISSSCASSMGGNFLQTGTLSPDNDLFRNAVELTGGQGTRAGSSVGAAGEAREPSHAGLGGGESIWYRWTAPRSGLVTFDTIGSGFDTVLAAYTGSDVSGLTQVAANDDIGGGTRQSSISFNATSGQTYRIAVDGYHTASPRSGSVSLQWNQPIPPPANDDFASGTTINTLNAWLTSETNEGATKESGEPSHAGKTGNASIWYRWTAPASGSVMVNTDNSAIDTVLAIYTGTAVNALSERASDDDGGAGSASRIEMPVVGGTTYRIAVDGYDPDDRGAIQVRLTYTDPPAPDTSITSAPSATTSSTSASFSFSASGQSTGFECKLDAGSWAGCSSPNSYSGLSVGPHTFSVRATGPGGTDTTPATHSWTVEAPPPPPAPDAAPETTILSGPPARNSARRRFVTEFTFSASEPATFQCRIGEAAWSSCASPAERKIKAPRKRTTFVFHVRATDSAGQTDTTPAEHEFSLKRSKKKRKKRLMGAASLGGTHLRDR